jgi:SPP1 gp7 family putative phage head morphogenesis protein
MPTSADLFNANVRHQTFLESLKTHEVNQLAAFLVSIEQQVRAMLSGDELTDFSRTRLESQLAALNVDMKTVFDEHYDDLSGRLTKIGDYEAGFEARAIGSAVAGFEAAIPAAGQVLAASRVTPLSAEGVRGQLLEPWLKDFNQVQRKAMTGIIRNGYALGQTNAQIRKQIRGTLAERYQDGHLAKLNRAASTITRTAIQHVANTARMETWEANDDIVKGYRWLSTLDSRTSPICRSLDQKVYKLGEGPLPPAHPDCRSTTTAELSEEYDYLKQGATRKSKGPNDSGTAPSGQKYYDWIQGQPVAYQNEILGTKRAKLLRDGGLSAERFADLQLIETLAKGR